MSNVPILYPGDKVHLAVPDPGDGGARVHQELTDIYASQGVEIICTSAITNLPQCSVVAVFRDEREISTE